jgi:hypothetical protein
MVSCYETLKHIVEHNMRWKVMSIVLILMYVLLDFDFDTPLGLLSGIGHTNFNIDNNRNLKI